MIRSVMRSIYALLVIELLLSFAVRTVRTSQNLGGANLRIEWTYENPGSLLEDGSSCDRIGGLQCDVFFTLCLRNSATSRAKRDVNDCLLLDQTTKYQSNMDYLEFRGDDAILVPIPQPVPNSFFFELGVYDYDVFSNVEKIAIFYVDHFKLLPTNNLTMVPIKRNTDNYQNKELRVTVQMKYWCHEHFYGNQCMDYCEPNPTRNNCSASGEYICFPGYRGVKCELEDSCYFEPCAEHSTCENLKEGNGRICICDGKDKPECYPNYDPCATNPCKNDGNCTAAGKFNESFLCTCTQYWGGHRCTDRRSACREEAQRLRQEYLVQSNTTGNNSINQTEICLNGGTCFEHPNLFKVLCVCLDGWTGDRCEIPVTLNTKLGLVSMIMIVVVAVLVVVLLSVIIFVVSRSKRIKRSAELNHFKGGVVYYDPNRTSINSLSMNRQFVNNIYTENVGPLPPIMERSSKSSESKSDRQSAAGVYDECDPLGLYAGLDIYGTAPNLEDPKISVNKPGSPNPYSNSEQMPPLPDRLSTFGKSANRNSTLTETSVLSRTPSLDKRFSLKDSEIGSTNVDSIGSGSNSMFKTNVYRKMHNEPDT